MKPNRSATAHPLQWPDGWQRTSARERTRGHQFKEGGGIYNPDRRLVTFDSARRKLAAELDRLGARDAVLSTNIPLRIDGQPRATEANYRMDDPGVAIYFTLRGRQMVMACDRYDGPAANCRSLGLAIEAMRQLERHGGGAMMERAFAGFAALPPPVKPQRPWRQVFGINGNIDRDTLDRRYRALASLHHPDAPGGSHEAMAELNAARDEAIREVGA
jgi:hypothetical protein